MTEGQQKSWLERAEALGRSAETWFLVALFILLLLLASAQILLRNVFSSGLAWADGLVRISVLWLAVMGAVAASRDQKHISIDLINRALSGAWRVAVVVGVRLFTAGVAAFFARQSWRFMQDSRLFEDVLLGGWPAWWFQLILPVGFGLIAYRYATAALRAIVRGL